MIRKEAILRPDELPKEDEDTKKLARISLFIFQQNFKRTWVEVAYTRTTRTQSSK